jgi:hypothetical protein
LTARGWLADVLRRSNDHPACRLDEFFPPNWKKPATDHAKAARPTVSEMKSETYVLGARWRPRPRTAAADAVSLAATLRGLAAVHPVFARWNRQGDTLEEAQVPFCTMPPRIDELTEIYRAQGEHDRMIHAWNGINGPEGCVLTTWTAMSPRHHPMPNSVAMRLRTRSAGNAGVQTKTILEQVLRAIVAPWQADWATVEPWGFPEFVNSSAINGYPAFRGGWITYLAAPFLRLITPPRSAILEPGPNDGLFLIATEEPLQSDNPSHVAVARDIYAALAPLNTLRTLPDAVG